MRIALLLLLATAGVSADRVVRTDGEVITGEIVEVSIRTPRGILRVKDVASVQVEMDRALLDTRWLASNLRFALERERAGVKPTGGWGVFMGAGVSAPSAQAVVRRLDAEGKPPRLMFDLDLRDLKAVVFPGGWAPSQNEALGDRGRAALREFVRAGGGYLGICAGSYLPCTAVVWEKKEYPYALGLARGKAIGPVPGLVAWPASQALRLTYGKKTRTVLYAGGCSFDIEGAEAIARYANERAAIVKLKHGQGRVILTGVHPEFTGTDRDLLAGWADDVKTGDDFVFRDLIDLLLHDRG